MNTIKSIALNIKDKAVTVWQSPVTQAVVEGVVIYAAVVAVSVLAQVAVNAAASALGYTPDTEPVQIEETPVVEEPVL